MDDAGLIVTALTLYGTVAASETCKLAVKDAYASLKESLQKFFHSKKNTQGELILKNFEEKPEVWKQPLADSLAGISAGRNADIIDAASRLIELIKPQQSATGKFIMQGEVLKGNIQADNITTVNLNLNGND